MTRNTHTVIHKVGGEYVRKIVPADPEPTLVELFVEALQQITILSNDDEVLVLADKVLKEYYDLANNVFQHKPIKNPQVNPKPYPTTINPNASLHIGCKGTPEQRAKFS